MPFIFGSYDDAIPLKHFVYGEQSQFDKELIRLFAIEYEKGTQNTSDGRPQIGTLKAISPVICTFRYIAIKHSNPCDVWFRYSRINGHVTTFNTGYTTRINRVIEHLDRLGFIEHRLSDRNSEQQSRFRFKPALKDILEQLKPKDIEDPLETDPEYRGIQWKPEHEVFVKPWVRRTYLERGSLRNRILKKRAKANNPYKRTITEELKEHNNFIKQCNIRVNEEELKSLEDLKKYEEFNLRYPIEKRTYRLFRLFMDEDWTEYGRFHGAWWQFLNSSLRNHLLINEKQTVELDYGGLQPNILFSLKNIDVGDDFDPYKIENRNAKEGEGEYHNRALVKKCFMYIANGKTPERYLTNVKGNLTRSINEISPTERNNPEHQYIINLRALLNNADYCDRFKEDLKQNWNEIWDEFREDGNLWKRLGFKESEMTNNIHKRMRDLEIPVLSIHDSYIATNENKDVLHEIMIEEFQNVLSTQRIPKIKEEGGNKTLTELLAVREEHDYDSDIYD